MSIEVMKQALGALEQLFDVIDKGSVASLGDVAVWRWGGSQGSQEAITALREAIEQQPAAWVGLTDEEIHDTEGYVEDRALYRFARVIEAKLKEKNYG